MQSQYKNEQKHSYNKTVTSLPDQSTRTQSNLTLTLSQNEDLIVTMTTQSQTGFPVLPYILT